MRSDICVSGGSEMSSEEGETVKLRKRKIRLFPEMFPWERGSEELLSN